MTDTWETWQTTRKQVYVSNKDAWGRRTHIEIGVYECEICNETTNIMQIDSSGGEYHSFDCCKPCFNKIWENT